MKKVRSGEADVPGREFEIPVDRREGRGRDPHGIDQAMGSVDQHDAEHRAVDAEIVEDPRHVDVYRH